MTIFKRRPNENFWCYKVRLGPNQWRTFRGFSDKRATDEKARQHQAQIDRGEVNIVNRFEEHSKRQVLEHVEDYLRELEASGHDVDNNHIVELRLKKMLNACGWRRLSDVTIAAFLRFRDAGDMAKAAPKTRNDYQQIRRQFCRWCVRNGRLSLDPFQNLATVKVNGDIRRQRRALTDQEVQRLLQVSPEPRRTVYLTALLTGLRRAELRQLRWSDVRFDATKPFIVARASTTKNSKEAVIFLRDDLVAALRGLDQANDANGPLFRVPKRVTFYKDLAAAKITRRDKQDRVVDFHCLRHTLATNLGRSGVSVRTAMEIMRHSDIRLTTKTYTDSSLLPTSEAIETLPRWEPAPLEREAIAIGTNDMEETQCATKGATKQGSFWLTKMRHVAYIENFASDDETRMASGETCDNQGVAVGTENMRPLGIEPRTHRLKVCCSTS